MSVQIKQNLCANNNNSNTYQINMIKACQPLKQLFDDINYAWELLEYQIKLETSDQISGQDISHLLQLYMRGVEKMNSLVDIRQSFFKNRVTSLMSRSNVIKTLNKPMSKKNQAPVVQSSPAIKIQPKVQLHLKQKKRQIQMRMAYGAEQHNPDALKKMIVQHSQKQSLITDKISKLVNTHEEKLMNRIKQRKLRTLTAKSRSEIYMNHDTNDTNGVNPKDRKQFMQKKRDEQQFGNSLSNLNKKQKLLMKKSKSLSPKRQKNDMQCQSPMKRRVSVDFTFIEKKSKQQ